MSQIRSTRILPAINNREPSPKEVRERYAKRIEQLINEKAQISAVPLHRPAEAVFKHGFVMLLMFGLAITTAGYYSGHGAAVVAGLLLSLFGISILALTLRKPESHDRTGVIDEVETSRRPALKDVPTHSQPIRISA